jgi:hypothetical protein
VKTVKVTLAEPPADSVTNVGLVVAPGPPETLDDRVTFPLNPFRLVMVMTDVAEEPDGKVNVDVLAETRKSGGIPTVTVILKEWERRPLVPMTVTVYVPAGVVDETVTVNVDVAETVAVVNTMLLGLASVLNPDGPGTDNEMVPLKPFRPLRVIVPVAEEPARIDNEGLAATVKSTTFTLMRTEWESEPLVPVTFTLYVP